MKQLFLKYIAAIAISFCPATLLAESFTVGDVTYETDPNDSEAVILTNGKSKSGEFEIPQKITMGSKTYYVRTIGKSAFYFSNLKSIIIPEGVTTIQESAFSYSKLESVQLPTTLNSIGNNAFYSTLITEIAIPKNVSSIGNQFLCDCDSLTTILVNGENEHFDSRNNCNAVIRKTDNVLIQGCKSSTIPEGIEVIGAYAFHEIPIKTISLPTTIRTIGKSAFYFSNLKSIIIPEGVTTIQESAFSYSKLESVQLPTTLNSIGNNAFYSIAKNATLLIPYGLTSFFEEKGVNQYFSTIEEYNISRFTYEGIDYLADENNPRNLWVIATNPKYAEPTYTIPSSFSKYGITYTVIGIGETAFMDCENLESIILPQTITTIEHEAFKNCSNLTSIDLSTTLTTIGYAAFYSCRKLSSIQFPTSLIKIGSNAFQYSGIKTVFIPQNLAEIGNRAFAGCDSLTAIIVDDNNLIYNSKDNCNAVLKGTELVAGCKNTIIPEGTTTIGDAAFYDHKLLIDITLPQSIKNIEDNAFSGCSNLKSINVPMSVTNIGDLAFYACRNLESIQIPENTLSIGEYAFAFCSELKEIESYIKNPFDLEEGVFDFNKNNTTLFVPVGTINDYKQKSGWKDFSNIQEIGLPVVFENSDFTFYGLKKKKTATITSFKGSDSIVVLPTNVSNDNIEYSIIGIKDSAFANSKIVSLEIPVEIGTIGQGILHNCYELAAIIWKLNTKPTQEFIKNIKNPNLLFYVKSANQVPNNIQNVVIGSEADNIILCDATNSRFYCPIPFVAKNISYTRSFSMKTEKENAQGWESIALPFDVQSYKTSKGEILKPYLLANAGEKRFWLREFGLNGFTETSVIRANTPYIISMPNWDGYQDYYNITGDVIFSAEDVTVPATKTEPITLGSYQFWPSFRQIETGNELYSLNKTEYGNNAPGSTFVKDIRTITPFEAYFTRTGSNAPTRSISIKDLTSGTTDLTYRHFITKITVENGVVYIDALSDGVCNIYTLNGQLFRVIILKTGKNVINDIPNGIYIINGRTIII